VAIAGEPVHAPAKTGNPVADINRGILAAAGIAAAYAHKLRTGQGYLSTRR
jgi:crotonobetainyl-CoA:carnitine CoA-transferase CaiB-like acyl-CoA transferase